MNYLYILYYKYSRNALWMLLRVWRKVTKIFKPS